MKYCDLTPPFPTKAYVVSVFFEIHDKMNIVTLPRIPLTHEEIQKDIRQIDQEFASHENSDYVTFHDSCSIIPITLSSKILLTPDLWQNPTLDYTEVDRQSSFLPVIENSQLYQLMVVGERYIEETNEWLFAATIPFLLTTPKEAITQFMQRSKAVVDIRAKYAALYDFGPPTRFDWKTGKTSKVFTPSADRPLN